jgi:hypothetical protein
MKSSGKLIYSPKSHLGSSSKWVILACDEEISKYYRHLFTKEYPYLNGEKTGKLGRPIWGSHISAVRSENVHESKWKIDNGKIIEFEYEPGVCTNGVYYWMRVSCPYLLDLREKMELSRQPRFGLHLTVGILANS